MHDVIGCHGLEHIRPVLYVLHAQPDRQGAAIAIGDAIGIVARIDLFGADLLLDPFKLFGIHTVFHETGNSRVHRIFGVL